MKINDEMIRVLLFRRKLTQKKLAEKIGVSRGSVSAVCNGRSCSLATAVSIADALGVSLDDIISRED